ncbi:MAG TPA: cyclic nucleotide-binding domain-containing protein [Terriglobales bacterium]|nr:cyclic nucleotide-binding domain-containing protein [Terriglobales bacterium]
MTNFTVTDDLRAKLKAMASPISKPKGTILFNQGEPALGIYLLDKGRVALHLDCGRRSFPTRVVNPGCVIGLPGTLSGTDYSLGAETLEDCTLDFIPRERLLEFLRENPAHCFQLVELLSREISELRSAAQRKRDLAIA